MLSIGKLAAGQASYYLDQPEGQVDVEGSIRDGSRELNRGRHLGLGR